MLRLIAVHFFFGLLLAPAVAPANWPAELDRWFFTAEEIEVAYRYQERFGERLFRPLRARDCLLGKKEFTAGYKGGEFAAPCRFIKETIRHLREMLEQGAARYLFPLDADHAHLAIPLELWENKYSKLPREQMLSSLLSEPALAALYHTAEHLTVIDPQTGKSDSQVRLWKDKRNVVGYYDGRPIEILPPDPRGLGMNIPQPYYSLGGFNFLASPKGELSLFLKNRAITFDISFDIGEPVDDALAAESQTRIVGR
jgi:hypothetical protein